jgi:hypothetical protein
MKDESKTKKQLINELVELRKSVTELETSKAERKQAEERVNYHRQRRWLENIVLKGTIVFVVVN